MDAIADNIEQLRELGISLGLDDQEIDTALHHSLTSEGGNVPAKKEGAAPEKTRDEVVEDCPRPSWLRCICFKWTFVVAFAVSVLLCLWCVLNGHSSEKDGGQTSVSYQIARIIRFMALPFVQYIDLTDFHKMTCLLPNPLYKPLPIDCEPCRDLSTIPHVSNLDSETFKTEYTDLSLPVLVEDEHTFVDFSVLRDMYERNKEKFSRGGFKLESTNDHITSLDVLMHNYSDESLLLQTGLHLHWSVSSVQPSRAFRTVFKRPYFVGKSAEILIDKIIIVESPGSAPYSLSGSHSPNLLLIQASGSRRLFLIPRANCTNKCQSLSVVISAGQALYIPDQVWRVDSIPASNATQELCISSVMNFS